MHPAQISFLDLLNGTVQYVVPRWQRRYRWGKADIERLVNDLLAVAEAGGNAAHYGGTLLTFPEPGPSGVVTTIRVVDGQQRLTTVSILLACIAEKLGPEGAYGEWTAQIIRNDRLTNPEKPPEKHRKLRLQEGDEDEYRSGLEGRPEGTGAVTQAWKIARRIVAKNDVGQLMEGLQRLRVVSIGLDEHEDPQQIFESLNATGKPLTESEKVKNWLLMGLPDAEQQDLHDNCWLVMERALGAEQDSQPTEIFLRDLLRWKTGELVGSDRTYEHLRRWLVQHGRNHGQVADRVALGRELTSQAKLYGTLTGTRVHSDAKVEAQLLHLRTLGIHAHRPFTLRLLNDSSPHSGTPAITNESLADILAGVGTWITRLWLAERPLNALNRAAAELAHEPGPGTNADPATHWIDRVRRLRNTRVGVPDDDAVRHGIHTRKAYGGNAGRSAFAVLCAMMEAEHREESPARARLTLEHVMPQKLTKAWKGRLGETAEEIHGKYRDRFANLTLSGDVTNSVLGTATFDEKVGVYAESTIGLTRLLAEESEWDKDALLRRADALVSRALTLWPWQDDRDTQSVGVEQPSSNEELRWRVEGGPWQTETAAAQMVLKVAGALLSLDPGNAERLSGDAISTSLQPASRYPAGSKAGSLTMRAVPGHPDYVMNPYERDYPASAARCRKMGKRCHARVEVAGVQEQSEAQRFFRFLEEHTGGLPGQESWQRGPRQWAAPSNDQGDRIGVSLNPNVVYLYVRLGQSQASAEPTARLLHYSYAILKQMPDQATEGTPETESREGRTVSLRHEWNQQDENDWLEAADWIKDQYESLQIILADPGEKDQNAPHADR